MAASLFAAVSCDLTLLPEDAVAPESYFKTEVDMQRWLNPLYDGVFMEGPGDGTNDNFNADDLVDCYLTNIIMGTRSPEDGMGSANLWNWSLLRRTNLFFEYSSNCKMDAVRTRYEGEAYFFRGLIYFHKVLNFGDVPWVDHVVGSTETATLNAPRNDRGTVMDHVMDDFDKAIASLPGTRSITRVNKWSALAFKARAALYEGTWRLYRNLPDAEKYLQIAADASKDIIEGGQYTLYNKGITPYRDLFNVDEIDEGEVLLARKYNYEDLKLGNSFQYTWQHTRAGFTKRFVNQYLMKDGSRFTDKPGYATASFVDEFKDRDPRMAQTILGPDYIQVGAEKKTVNDLTSMTGYTPIKYVSDSSHDRNGTCDWPIIRLAEVYLTYAEAMAELGKLTQDDLDMTVNRLRDRVGMPHLDMAAANANPDKYLGDYYDKSLASGHINRGVLLEIRRERTIELVAEGIRQWDLFRWKEGRHMVNETDRWLGVYFPGPGTYDLDGDGTPDVELYEKTKTGKCANTKKIGDEITLSNGTSGYMEAFAATTYKWNEDRDYLYPVPVDQRILTGGALTQNPGWADTYMDAE